MCGSHTLVYPSIFYLSNTSQSLIHQVFILSKYCAIRLLVYSGSDGTLAELAYEMAAAQGFNIPFDNVAMFGSHTHSGPGAITPEMLWAVAPATDLLVPGKKSQILLVKVVNFCAFQNCRQC